MALFSLCRSSYYTTNLKLQVVDEVVLFSTIVITMAEAQPNIAPGTKHELQPGWEKATFGAGCFWGVEATFRRTKGVKSTAVGYEGGSMKNPTYKDVCTDRTGHAEVVEVIYDPKEVSYEDLLNIFWENHDPTTLNRQGPDVGTQYRSVVFYHSPEQKEKALASKNEMDGSGKFRRPIVTQVVEAEPFYAAEDYHQQYLEKRGLASCHI